jgi:hypothetical protein
MGGDNNPLSHICLNFLSSMVISALSSVIWVKLSKGAFFFASSSPAANEETVMLPDIF